MVGETFLDVDHVSDSIRIGGIELVPSPVNLVSFNYLAVWINSMLSAEIDTFLSRLDSSDERSGDRKSVEHQRELRDRVRCSNGSKLNDVSILVEKLHVEVQIMVSANSV